jgi:hypothetical protein
VSGGGLHLRVACPVCGGDLPAMHRLGEPWSPQTLLIARRMVALGVSYSRIGHLFGVKANAVAQALSKELSA